MLIIGEFSISRHTYIQRFPYIPCNFESCNFHKQHLHTSSRGSTQIFTVFSTVLDVSFTRPLCFTPRLEISWNTVSRERFIIARQLRIGETVNVGTCWVSGKVIDATSKPSVSSPPFHPFLESNIFKLEGSRSKHVSMVFGSIDENMECVFADWKWSGTIRNRRILSRRWRRISTNVFVISALSLLEFSIDNEIQSSKTRLGEKYFVRKFVRAMFLNIYVTDVLFQSEVIVNGRKEERETN